MTIETLGQLDAAVRAAGIPINGINSSGVIAFKPAATDQQKADAQAIFAQASLFDARNAAAKRIATGYAAAFAAGFDPNGIASITGVTWKLRGADIDKLSKDLGYQQSCIAAAADETARNTLLASSIAIPTSEGPKSLTVAQVVTLYLALGAWARAIEQKSASKNWNAATASTEAIANAIEWED